MSKKVYTILWLLLFTMQLLSAQPLWQNETIVRKNEIIDWPGSVVNTATGNTIIMWASGQYGNQGLYLHKLDNSGQPLWDEDICLTNSPYLKWSQAMNSDDQGNIFVRWQENHPDTGTILYIAKLNENGLFLWQPVVSISIPSLLGNVMIPDNNGGLFIIYSKSTGGSAYNLFCQHLSPTGQCLLPGEGAQLTNETRQVNPGTVKLASDNSLIFSYSISYDNGMMQRLMRMLPDYSVAWSNSYNVTTTPTYSTSQRLAAIDSTQYIITWNEPVGSTGYLYMQKFDLEGTFLFNPPILLDSSTISSSIYSSLGNDHQGNLYIGIHKGANMDPMANEIRKYDYLGNSIWATPVTLSDSITAIYNPFPDNNGGCYLLLKSIRNNDSSRYDFKLQHIDSNGQILWPNGGQELVNQIPYKHHYKIGCTFTDRFNFLWVNNYEAREGLYCQIRNTDGQLISAPGITIADALGGTAALANIIPANNNVFVSWFDSRQGQQYYYQIVNPDGSFLMPENGAILGENYSGSIKSFISVKLDNGTIVSLWCAQPGTESYIIGQAVDMAGNVLWEPSGRIFNTTDSDIGFASLIAFAEGNDVYYTYQAKTGAEQYHTFAQKIADGQLMWGTQGIMIDTGITNPDYLHEYPVLFRDRYLVIRGRSGGLTGNIYLWVVHLEADGTFSSDWLPNGVLAVNVGYLDYYSFTEKVGLADGYIYLLNNYHNTPWHHYSYTIVNSSGNVFINQAPLTNSAFYEFALAIDTTDGLFYGLILTSLDYSQKQYVYGKMSAPDVYPWGQEYQLLLDYPGNYNYNCIPVIHGFSNGGYVVNWVNSYKIWGSYIAPSGELMSPMNGIELLQNCFDTRYSTVLNDELYIAWNDFKVGSFSYYDYEIRLQKFANLTTPVSDDHNQLSSDKLLCYPNPFNSSVNIELNILTKENNELAVYNVKGQKVTTIESGVLEKGEHTFTWNGKDSNGKQVSTGIYYLRLRNSKGNSVAKLLYMK